MRLLLDMNLSPQWVRYLNEAGFETEHWSKAGSANATDLEIMDYAKNRDLVVVTQISILGRYWQRRTVYRRA